MKPHLTEAEILSHEFLTIEEVATLLRVSVRTVYNLIYNGRLSAIKVSYQITRISKENFIAMVNNRIEDKKPKAQTVSSSKNEGRKGKEEAAVKPKCKPRKRTLLASSNYKVSVRDSYVDVEDADMSVPTYTMAELCRKFNYSYGRFYALRLRYEITCIRGSKPKRFPCAEVDRAMAEEADRLCREEKEKWLTCADIMGQYGLGKTQVRRFAQTHGVRIRKAGKNNYYLKADWEAARIAAEEKSSSTKAKRPQR